MWCIWVLLALASAAPFVPQENTFPTFYTTATNTSVTTAANTTVRDEASFAPSTVCFVGVPNYQNEPANKVVNGCAFGAGCATCSQQCAQVGLSWYCCYGNSCCCYSRASVCSASPYCPHTFCTWFFWYIWNEIKKQDVWFATETLEGIWSCEPLFICRCILWAQGSNK